MARTIYFPGPEDNESWPRFEKNPLLDALGLGPANESLDPCASFIHGVRHKKRLVGDGMPGW